MKNQKIQTLTDEQLVTHFQTSGENVFFGEIYNRYYKKTFHTCLGIVHDREAAYDLVQDIMMKVMAKLPTLQHGFLLGFWIHRIAKNKSIDYWKESKNNRYTPVEECTRLAEDYTVDQETKEARYVMLSNIAKQMKTLKENDQRLLSLKYFENYSVEDLEREFNLSKSAVKMRLSRARNRMKILLEEQTQNRIPEHY